MSGGHIALLGGGKMGEALLAGVVRAGGPDSVVVVERFEERAAQLRADYGVRTTDARTAASAASTVIVAVKPGDVDGVLRDIADVLPSDALVVSVAAGLTTTRLAAALRPGQPVVRVMPNTPAFVGAGMSVMSAGSSASPEHLDRAEALLAPVGRVARVDEHLQDAVTAVSGSGPAYVFYLVEAMVDAGVSLGLPRELATELAVQTAFGAGALLRESGEDPAVLRTNVTSPGGTTAAAVAVFDERGLRDVVRAALEACRDRSVEMGTGRT
jgi:pyrroline-5-carboxylate reductase